MSGIEIIVHQAADGSYTIPSIKLVPLPIATPPVVTPPIDPPATGGGSDPGASPGAPSAPPPTIAPNIGAMQPGDTWQPPDAT